MAKLNDIAEQLTAGALAASPENLPGLANIHEILQTLLGEIAQPPTGSEKGVLSLTEAAQEAAGLVEKIILRDIDDAQVAVDELCQQINEIHSLINGSAGEKGVRRAWADGSAVRAADILALPPAASVPPGVPRAAEASVIVPLEDSEPLPKEEDLPTVGDFIGEAREHLTSAEAALLKIEEQPEDEELVNAIFRSFHTIKGVAGFLNLQQMGRLAHAAETVLDRGRKGELAITGATLDVILEAVDLAKALLGQLEGAVQARTPIPMHPGLKACIERLGATVDGAASKAGASEKIEPPAPLASECVPAPAAAMTKSASADAGGGPVSSAPVDATVKVSTARLDALINMVGELVIAQAMVSQDMATRVGADQRVARNLSQLGKITRELQDLTMAMRMVPIQGAFQKMSRLVRDLSRKAGKELTLTIEGGETEVDRNLVESIADPLVHMVRNSSDHGIEPPEERVRVGKPRGGRIHLKAHHQAGNIVVEISDDGRGLNKQRILAKARSAGLVRENQELSDQDIFRLIFAPGLSTAEKVTDVSGRGVGMDVVRRNVEALRGRIDITSEEGKGSTFSIRLPLTLAVIDGLVIKVGAARYILPLASIEQSLRPRAEQLSTVHNRGEMCMIRERLIPLVRLHKLFNVTPRTTDPCAALLVLVQDGAQRCCLLVDELLGQQQVVIKSLGRATETIRGVSGGAILGDGTISLILDVPGLIDLAERT
jgi:two-component system, chemotaxis family, sensor kinase CheA